MCSDLALLTHASAMSLLPNFCARHFLREQLPGLDHTQFLSHIPGMQCMVMHVAPFLVRHVMCFPVDIELREHGRILSSQRCFCRNHLALNVQDRPWCSLLAMK
jgi:hypothetical protein